jgi:PIN domain nuclease of toxin-antitoxin system
MNQTLLLDTHTFIWFIEGDPKLPLVIRTSIENQYNFSFVSTVSLWEIAIKVSLGKLELNTDFSRLKLLIDQNGFQMLNINFEHLERVKILPYHHRDPFDRLIIAQGMEEEMIVVTKDDALNAYDV